jgi:hypothetical protein
MVDRLPGSHQQIAEISLGNDQGRREFAAGSGKREGEEGLTLRPGCIRQGEEGPH